MTLNNSILLVDDESYALEFLSYNLERNGFHVFTSTSGKQAIEMAGKIVPRMILLDIMMPGMDGVETCIELRKNSKLRDTFIAFLTARTEDYSQVAGFEAGADDYIEKPVRIGVLIPRLKAHFRRLDKKRTSQVIQLDELEIAVDRHHVRRGEEVIRLNRKEFQVLKLLAVDPTRVFSASEIFNAIWGSQSRVRERTVNVHISRLRRKLGKEYILTVGKNGYRLR